MTFRRFAAAFIAAMWLAAAPAALYAAVPKFAVINTKITPKHSKTFAAIPVYMKVAPGLTIKETPTGYADAAKKISFEGTVLHAGFNRITACFSNQALKNSGIEIKRRTECKWNGERALLMNLLQRGKQGVTGKWTLVIDRGEKCWMINGLYSAGSKAHNKVVLDMIKSVCWKDEMDTDQIMAPGSIDTGGTEFRPAGVSDGALIYSRDGLLPTKSPDEALFVLSRLPNTPVASETHSLFAREKIAFVRKGQPLDIISENSITAGGLQGIELTAYADGEKHTLVYQTILYGQSDCIVMVGLAKENTQECMVEFSRLAATYRQ